MYFIRGWKPTRINTLLYIRMWICAIFMFFPPFYFFDISCEEKNIFK